MLLHKKLGVGRGKWINGLNLIRAAVPVGIVRGEPSAAFCINPRNLEVKREKKSVKHVKN